MSNLQQFSHILDRDSPTFLAKKSAYTHTLIYQN